MLGIAFSDTEIHAVLARGTAVKGSVDKTFTEKLPEGAMKNGLITKAEKVIETLKKIQKASGSSGVVICLPPEQVYSVNFTVAPEHGKSFRERMEAAMEQYIPEEKITLQYQTKILKTTKEGKLVGVLAVRKDILQEWNEACKKAGLTIKSVTSLPLSIADKGSFALATAGSSFKPTLTLFHNGWPIDEAVLPEEASVSAIADELKEFIEEYMPEYPVSMIWVAGGADFLKKIQDVFIPKKKSKDEQSPPSVSVTAILSWVKEKEMPMLGAIAASLSGSGSFNLLRSQKQKTMTAVLALVFVLVMCAGVVAYFRPDLVPGL